MEHLKVSNIYKCIWQLRIAWLYDDVSSGFTLKRRKIKLFFSFLMARDRMNYFVEHNEVIKEQLIGLSRFSWRFDTPGVCARCMCLVCQAALLKFSSPP